MAQSNITVRLTTNLRCATAIAWALYPLVFLRAISVERAVAFAMRFARVDAKVEGWGGD
ncbi:MAG: hypothetical protein QM681_16840 [Novosphingobium sp.]